jgi:hypothetical protein
LLEVSILEDVATKRPELAPKVSQLIKAVQEGKHDLTITSEKNLLEADGQSIANGRYEHGEAGGGAITLNQSIVAGAKTSTGAARLLAALYEETGEWAVRELGLYKDGGPDLGAEFAKSTFERMATANRGALTFHVGIGGVEGTFNTSASDMRSVVPSVFSDERIAANVGSALVGYQLADGEVRTGTYPNGQKYYMKKNEAGTTEIFDTHPDKIEYKKTPKVGVIDHAARRRNVDRMTMIQQAIDAPVEVAYDSRVARLIGYTVGPDYGHFADSARNGMLGVSGAIDAGADVRLKFKWGDINYDCSLAQDTCSAKVEILGSTKDVYATVKDGKWGFVFAGKKEGDVEFIENSFAQKIQPALGKIEDRPHVHEGIYKNYQQSHKEAQEAMRSAIPTMGAGAAKKLSDILHSEVPDFFKDGSVSTSAKLGPISMTITGNAARAAEGTVRAVATAVKDAVLYNFKPR